MKELSDAELLLKEAEWVWSEMEDFVRQIHQYRLAYVTSLFAALVWFLSKLLDGMDSVPGRNFEAFRARLDVAAVLLFIPMLVGVYTLLTMEADRQIRCLARYRFLLSCKLGSQPPIWRWELFRRTEDGSSNRWTVPANVMVGLLTAALVVACFTLTWTAKAANHYIAALWWFSLCSIVGVIASMCIGGWGRWRQNAVADGLGEITYDTLLTIWAKAPSSKRWRKKKRQQEE